MMILVLLTLVMGVNCGKVDVDHGILTISGYNKCFVQINDMQFKFELNGTKYVHDTFVLGLLKWKCDHDFGSRAVEIDCKDCGIYCSYNQQFEKCKNTWIVPLIAVITSLFIIKIILLVIILFFKETVHKIFLKVVLKILTINDRKRAKKVRMLNVITGSKNPILFRLIYTQSDELNKMIMKYRLALRKEITGDEPIYEEICQKGYEANKFSRDIEMKVMNSSHLKMGERAARALVVGLAVQSATSAVYACDKTLYISSAGKVCDSINCNNVNMYSLPIQSGSTICFNTVNGDQIELRIKDTKTTTRYHSSYYACSFKANTKTTWECKSPSSNCWNGGNCHVGYEHPGLKQNENLPHGYGCQSDTIGCDTWCWHAVSCVWYSWVLEPILNECYPVYHKVSEIWQTSVFIKYKGITKHIKLNSNNPRYNLNGADIDGLKDMPIIINSLTHEQIHLRNSIIIKNGRAYEVDASMTNFPVKNTIGEYQMSLDKASFTAYTSNIRCQMNSCKGNCTYDEPSVNRLDENRYGVIPKGQVFKNGDHVLKRQIPVSATANLIIGSVEIDSLLVTPSSCKISVESTLACTSCDTKPYAIFKAYDIKTEGILEFESNCSWVLDTMSCNPEPYIMQLNEMSDKCLINIKSTNQSFMVDFKYIFNGQLTLLKTYYGESTMEALTEH